MRLLSQTAWIIVFVITLKMTPTLYAQEENPKKLYFNGYLSEMPSLSTNNYTKNWQADNQMHNRLNFKYINSANTLKTALEIRNRWMYGETVSAIPNYAKSLDTDNGFVDLSFNWIEGPNYVVNTSIDRAFLSYTKNMFEVRIGRQRINWGQCLVWNPNDLFNTYSYYDFDYVEKPGADAIRLQYYPSTTSTIELASKIDGQDKITTALLWRFNKKGYDIQILSGLYSSNNWMAGLGWTGNILNAGFCGEISYFKPITSKDTLSTLVASFGSNYTFSNALTLQTEYLYNQNAQKAGNFLNFYQSNLTPKNLSISKSTFFISASYPASPLLSISLASIYYADIKSYFVGPSLTYSITENIDAMIYDQFFVNQAITEQTIQYNLLFARVKWNF